MDFIILTISVVLGVVFGRSLAKHRGHTQFERGRDILHEKIEEEKKEILGFLKKKKNITNDDVEELLGVSDATARNRLQDLEDDGKIVQIGKTGRGVSYELK